MLRDIVAISLVDHEERKEELGVGSKREKGKCAAVLPDVILSLWRFAVPALPIRVRVR